MIIEFYGLPGSGKSTISNDVTNALRQRGKSVSTYENYLEFLQKTGRLKSLISVLTGSAGRTLFLDMTELAIQTHTFFKADIYKRLLSCLCFYHFYKSNSSEYIVMDEGIIQGVVSALFVYDKNDASFGKLIKDITTYLNIVFISVNVQPDLASDRIESRKSLGHGRCDDISDRNERIGVLRHQEKNFDLIGAEINHWNSRLIIDSQNDVNESVSSILNQILIEK